MKHMRLLITEKCNANCKNCFNATYRLDNEMPLDRVKSLAEHLANEGVKAIYVEGGEPTIHTDFNNVINVLQENFESVIVFTNGLSDNLLSISLRPKDSIVYNFNFAHSWKKNSGIVASKPGKRSFMVQISTGTDVDSLIKALKLYDDYLKKENFSILITLDCTVDIFSEAEVLSQKWNSFVASCIINCWNLKIDHGFPLCIKKDYNCLMIEIYMGKVSDVSLKTGLYWCDYRRAGLIDADFNLRYCNNYYKTIAPFITDVGRYLSKNEFLDFLIKTDSNKQQSLPQRCLNCDDYKSKKCNATCFGCRQK